MKIEGGNQVLFKNREGVYYQELCNIDQLTLVLVFKFGVILV